MQWLDNWIKKRADALIAKQEAAGKPQLQRIVSEESELWRDSKEPWVTIIGDTVTDIQYDKNMTILKTKNIIGMIPYSKKIAQSGREDQGVLFEDISYIDSIRDILMEGVMHE